MIYTDGNTSGLVLDDVIGLTLEAIQLVACSKFILVVLAMLYVIRSCVQGIQIIRSHTNNLIGILVKSLIFVQTLCAALFTSILGQKILIFSKLLVSVLKCLAERSAQSFTDIVIVKGESIFTNLTFFSGFIEYIAINIMVFSRLKAFCSVDSSLTCIIGEVITIITCITFVKSRTVDSAFAVVDFYTACDHIHERVSTSRFITWFTI